MGCFGPEIEKRVAGFRRVWIPIRRVRPSHLEDYLRAGLSQMRIEARGDKVTGSANISPWSGFGFGVNKEDHEPIGWGS
jgi:hypothetical protein